ncbi:MAG: TAXI family TRAP transporter solute-binding subunit [Geminicoccaceae bacterium]
MPRAGAILGLLLLLALPAPAYAADTRLQIATGGVTGVYYQFGAAICRLLRDHPPAQPITCTTEGSAGAVNNLVDLRLGRVPMATVQADMLAFAAQGRGVFASAGPDREVRALFTFATETLNLLVRADEEAAGLAELRGRRLNAGVPGSGTAVTMRRVLTELGWTERDLDRLTDYRSALQSSALCRRRIDAAVFIGANPSGAVQDATFACAARLVPLAPPLIDSLTARYPFYVPAVIPGGTYANNPQPVRTVGVHATLVAARATPDTLVYEVTRVVLEHLAELRTLHLAFAGLDLARITGPCVAAPIHPGAARYYREHGLHPATCPVLAAADPAAGSAAGP